ncbi:response regulator transcription factor [Clostridium sp. ZS2-4]|uniref:response regulator transcription factor n=1 Tax=Clostridium sp. ZS2-4 TaxID=2987703 RepID=UPI00227AEF67|nr:response regulator transcription factor [Clostridium sp. ZS2-4]MCY6354652.1 response regulator transcription factor [Clostridium sp. ZS2-4]
MNTKTILFADDEALMIKLVGDFLKREGYDMIEAQDGKEALELFHENKENINLAILDVMMPFCDGWSVCREMRKTSNIPIIMLTARDEESDELFGFDLGADEYITKPFSPNILVARVNALLRRVEQPKNSVHSFEDLVIDESAHNVSVQGKSLELSPKEYELLIYMVENNGIALSREQILNGVWGYDYFGDLRTVDTHIKRLRSKLDNKGEFIQTVRGFGYKFEV